MAKSIIKWISVAVAGLLVAAVVFTAVFLVIPLSRSVRNLQEKKENATSPAATQAAPTTQPPLPETTEAQAEPASAPPQAPEQTEFDIYRSGKFYVTGSVTDSDGQTNPMEMAITDGSVYMLTAVSDVQMGFMVGDGKTYLVSPEHRCYLELNNTVMSVLGLDAAKLSAPSSFNFSDMRPLAEADEVNETELNGAPCREYVFHVNDGRKSCVYMDGARMLQADIFNGDGSLYNRMTFTSVSAEIPYDRVAPPTYFTKMGLLKFISTMSASLDG